MSECLKFLTEEDRIKRLERRHKPTAIAHRFLEHLQPIEQPGTRFNLLLENIANSIQRCQNSSKNFHIDTITCPLYQFAGDLGKSEDFSVISGVGENLEDNPRYFNKFKRYLVTLAETARVLKTEGVNVKGRVYFGDGGVLNVDKLKQQFGVDTDDEIRVRLKQNALTYQRCLEQGDLRQKLGLPDVLVEFNNLTEVVPCLKELPLDLCEAAAASGAVKLLRFTASLNEDVLEKQGVNQKIIRTAKLNAEYLGGERLKESPPPRRNSKYSVVERVYLEVVGFLLNYGLAGEALSKRENKTDLLVSIDTPGSYRTDFYYTFLGEKGEKLGIFTPANLEKMPAEFQAIFRS